MAGNSVFRRVNNCKCMENYQIFRRVKSFEGVTHAQGVCLGRSVVKMNLVLK